jgi:hypothetical protein
MNDNNELTDGILGQVVGIDGELKERIVSYVGNKLNPVNNEVTIEMVIDILASEFPDLVLAIAEENFLRGYERGLDDSATGFMANEQPSSIFQKPTEEPG